MAGAGQTSHNLLLRLLLLLHLPPVPRALFQDVYKYENRTCLLTPATRTETTRRASRYPRWMLYVARRIGHVPEGARRDDDRSPGIFGIAHRVALIILETYLSECVFCPLKKLEAFSSRVFLADVEFDDNYRKFLRNCFLVSRDVENVMKLYKLLFLKFFVVVHLFEK